MDEVDKPQPVRRKSDQVLDHEAHYAARSVEQEITDAFDATEFGKALLCKCQHCMTLRSNQYVMEALESKHGPQVWFGEEIDPGAQDAIDDNRLVVQRKRTPVATGFLAYFPNAVRAVARVSEAGNRQHHGPDAPLHWDRTMSTDEADACVRHLLDHLSGDYIDKDGQLHLAKVAWRAMAMLERYLSGEVR